MRADHLLFGYSECRVRNDHAACFLSLCHRLEIVYVPVSERRKETHADEDGAMRVRFRLANEKRVLTACAAQGIDLRVVRRGGLPVAIRRYRMRIGVPIGVLLAACVIAVSSRVVWDIRIDGGENMTLPALRELLGDCGLAVGAWIPALETDAVENRLLTGSEDIAWASVNVKGTVAYVQLRELMKPKSAVSDEPTNLIARCDGVIDSVKLISGQVAVKPGDVVREGQLLVSGVRDSTVSGYGVEAAQGEILARVEDTLTVQIERLTRQKVYVTQKKGEKTLFFFGKTVKVSKKPTMEEQNCDIIKRIDVLGIPGGAALPVFVETEVLRLYEFREVTMTDEQLTARAYEELGRALALATEEAMLVSKQVTCELTDTGVLLTCRYECVKNIAVAQPLG